MSFIQGGVGSMAFRFWNIEMPNHYLFYNESCPKGTFTHEVTYFETLFKTHYLSVIYIHCANSPIERQSTYECSSVVPVVHYYSTTTSVVVVVVVVYEDGTVTQGQVEHYLHELNYIS